MNEAAAPSILCGVLLGIGLWLVLVRMPVMRRPRFADRIAPALRSVNNQSRLLDTRPVNLTPFGPLERIFRPVLRDAVGWLGRFNIGAAALARRLVQAGRQQRPEDFRAEQLSWGIAGLALGIGGATIWSGSSNFNPALAVVLTIGLALAGFLLRDYLLSVRIQARERKMLAEFPSLAELMALAVSAGESATGALERVCSSACGELSAEFSLVLAATRSGTPLITALKDFSDRTQLAPLVRFVDGLSVAIERGTPLADVLRAQAQDVRDMAKRDLMESAGRKEIAMMVPLVFGVLPLTVLFAVYPGLAAISLGM